MLKLNNYFDIKWLVLALLSITTVITLTHIPQESMPSKIQEHGLDKILHILAYGTITFCVILSFQKPPSKYAAVIIFCFLLTIGIIDESTQPLVNRDASLTDLIADSFGILTILLLLLFKKKAIP
ncbi:MAG: VanZ family protein [Sedimentisphaerales bacterium]|nr:VanZ family protein [Sedimentisphaerales bacterium]